MVITADSIWHLGKDKPFTPAELLQFTGFSCLGNNKPNATTPGVPPAGHEQQAIWVSYSLCNVHKDCHNTLEIHGNHRVKRTVANVTLLKGNSGSCPPNS